MTNGRDLNLSVRKENTRQKYHTDVIRFTLDEIMEHFKESLRGILDQFCVADELNLAGKNIESENVLRAQIVFLSSAIDFYMHELTKYGLCEIYDGNWEKTEKYENLRVDMKTLEIALEEGRRIDWFLEYINSLYQSITLVSFNPMKEQMNLLGIDMNEVAKNAFYDSESREKPMRKMKERLNEMFARRNFISHQSDRSHVDATTKIILKKDVEDFIHDGKKIINAIDMEARKKCTL